MTDVVVQFHALPEEVVEFAKKCMEEFGLHLVALKFFPFEAREITFTGMDEVLQASPPYREVALSIRRPVLPASDETHFEIDNPELLRIDLQRVTDKGLRQASLAARTDDAEALAMWKKIAKRLKAITRAGVVVVNPTTGATAPAREFRYTEGARAIAEAGVDMLPVAGGNLIVLSSPQ